jgi:hypothetical protein
LSGLHCRHEGRPAGSPFRALSRFGFTCDERDLADEQITRFPKLIVEVLSKSTAAVDRGDKFEEYSGSNQFRSTYV